MKFNDDEVFVSLWALWAVGPGLLPDGDIVTYSDPVQCSMGRVGAVFHFKSIGIL